MRCIVTGLAAISFFVVFTLAAVAEADGPDAWDVTGVAPGDTLNVREAAGPKARKIAEIPPGAKGLRNLGCKGGPSFAQWQHMSPLEQKRAADRRWCKVEYEGRAGWVAGRFLKESSGSPSQGATSAAGVWTVRCEAKPCVIEQVAIATTPRSMLRIEPADNVNFTVSVLRPTLPARGIANIYMDGDEISGGNFERTDCGGTACFVLGPDDVSAGLIKQMRKHENMVISVPDQERGMEFRLKGLATAIASALQGKAR